MSPFRYSLALVLLALGAGCQTVPKSQLSACQSQFRAMTAQNRAQLAEMENLKSHSRQIEDQLAQAEDELSSLYDQSQLARRDPRRSGGRVYGPNGRMAELARRHRSLRYDPQTGSCKFDSELLFDTGKADLKPEAQAALRDLYQMVTAGDSNDLNLMIVGHADDRQVAKRETRENYPSNQHLSVARALAVENYLTKLGLPGQRMGVTGFGAYQPVAASQSTDDRQRNRRAEIFLVSPETPVIGRTDSRTDRY